MADTLFEFYKEAGLTLPGIPERAQLYESYGLGPASGYTGTAAQNTRLLTVLEGASDSRALEATRSELEDSLNYLLSQIDPNILQITIADIQAGVRAAYSQTDALAEVAAQAGISLELAYAAFDYILSLDPSLTLGEFIHQAIFNGDVNAARNPFLGVDLSDYPDASAAAERYNAINTFSEKFTPYTPEVYPNDLSQLFTGSNDFVSPGFSVSRVTGEWKALVQSTDETIKKLYPDGIDGLRSLIKDAVEERVTEYVENNLDSFGIKPKAYALLNIDSDTVDTLRNYNEINKSRLGAMIDHVMRGMDYISDDASVLDYGSEADALMRSYQEDIDELAAKTVSDKLGAAAKAALGRFGVSLFNSDFSFEVRDAKLNPVYTVASGHRGAFYGADVAEVFKLADGNDYVYGGAGDDMIMGGAGNDTLIGGAGTDKLSGDDGDDFLEGGKLDQLSGGNGNDTYHLIEMGAKVTERANAGDDVLYANFSLDVAKMKLVNIETFQLEGSAGLFIKGGAGNETLRGNDGNNLLDGGLGSDTLMGGLGNDIFALTTKAGPKNVDTIVDFVSGSDKILLSAKLSKLLDVNKDGALDAAAFGSVLHQDGRELMLDTKPGKPGGDIVIALIGSDTMLSITDFLVGP